MSVHDPSGGPTKVDIWALIDTGADDLQIDQATANAVNIDLSKASTVNRKVASGSTVKMLLVTKVPITVEGKKSSGVDVLIGPKGVILLGRRAIIATIDFGMDQTGWSYL
jgi:predicted aspartyl protease